jgi:hypothetical protein
MRCAAIAWLAWFQDSFPMQLQSNYLSEVWWDEAKRQLLLRNLKLQLFIDRARSFYGRLGETTQQHEAKRNKASTT